MTVDELLTYHKLRYINELCSIYGVEPITVYKWSSDGIPHRRQKQIAKSSKGVLTVSFIPKN